MRDESKSSFVPVLCTYRQCPATMATRKPSYSRVPSVNLSKRSSLSSYNSDDFFKEPSPGGTDGEAGDGIWNTARRKFTLVALCLVYFAATASFAILSPFFPGEVKLLGTNPFARNDYSPDVSAPGLKVPTKDVLKISTFFTETWRTKKTTLWAYSN